MRVTTSGLVAAALIFAAAVIGCNNGSGNQPTANENMGPNVQATVSPANGSVNVPRTASIVVHFDHAMMMDPPGHSFALHRGGGTGSDVVPGAFNWNSERTEFTFYPANTLDSNATYTIHMAGMLMDMDSMICRVMMSDTSGMGGMPHDSSMCTSMMGDSGMGGGHDGHHGGMGGGHGGMGDGHDIMGSMNCPELQSSFATGPVLSRP